LKATEMPSPERLLPPTAVITTDLRPPSYNLPVSPATAELSAEGSVSNNGGTIVDYKWSVTGPLGYSTLEKEGGKKLSFQSTALGAYTISLVVTDDKNIKSANTATQLITVCNIGAPDCLAKNTHYANIVADKYVVKIGETVNLRANYGPSIPSPIPIGTFGWMKPGGPPGGTFTGEFEEGVVKQWTAPSAPGNVPISLNVLFPPPPPGGISINAPVLPITVLANDPTGPTVTAKSSKNPVNPGDTITLSSTFTAGFPAGVPPPQYTWSIQDGGNPIGTENSISPVGSDGSSAKWTVPNQMIYPEVYIFKVEVKESTGAIGTNFVKVIVTDPKPPVADKPKPGNPKKPNDPSNPKKPNDPSNPKKPAGPITSTTIVDSFKDKTGSKSTLDSNKIIRTAGTNCLSLSDTLTLGPNTIAPKNFKVLADFDKCSISDATIILNIPQNTNLKLAAGNFDKPNNVIVVPTKDIKTPPTGNKMTQADIQTRVIGQDLFTKQMKAITNVDGLILWNDSPTDSIILTKNDNGIISAQFAKPNP
jgi:hypothetical protein